MPRQSRLELPGIPMHVVQRGVNRRAIFLDDEDRHHYRRLLHQAYERFGMRVHAFVLMDNHVHLFVSSDQVGAVSAAMRLSGQSHVQAFNARHGRSGTLWQGRSKSCLVRPEHYLLTVLRYIELNPVRARMIAMPEEHRWSSVHTHLGRAADPLVTPHEVYPRLGAEPAARVAAYGAWLRSGQSQEDAAAIRRHVMQERALGDPRFQAMVERTLGRPAACRARGRPKAASSRY